MHVRNGIASVMFCK